MKMAKHPNIMEFYKVMASNSKIYITMKLVYGGETFNKVSKGQLKKDMDKLYFQQLIFIIDFYHNCDVYHYDLKLENLLLDEHDNLKVSKFKLNSFSKHIKEDRLLHTTCSTPMYMLPEVIVKKG